MNKFLGSLIAKLARDEKGLTAVEYAVLGAVVVAAIVAVGANFKTQLGAAFTTMFNSIPSS
ncbi:MULTISPECIES: Flp family type IVb pilin [Sphingobium]|uniref:Pilus assembly protein n=1 Tax=Sphingobium chungbukense TaxID=56193 RepID=A0A0M3AS17_9SPHN|nr:MULTISPECIES: Flp family type IVb pilin [Sphingobium]KKW91701.1 pilus assembly protein [Sphingobium chungbukense]PJG45843.1 Flp family type IVb pilin [Sphingobium sp. LB126]